MLQLTRLHLEQEDLLDAFFAAASLHSATTDFNIAKMFTIVINGCCCATNSNLPSMCCAAAI